MIHVSFTIEIDISNYGSVHIFITSYYHTCNRSWCIITKVVWYIHFNHTNRQTAKIFFVIWIYHHTISHSYHSANYSYVQKWIWMCMQWIWICMKCINVVMFILVFVDKFHLPGCHHLSYFRYTWLYRHKYRYRKKQQGLDSYNIKNMK